MGRAVAALEFLAGAPSGRGVSDLARELGVHKSSASRLLATLRARGLVDLDAVSGHFGLGAGFLRLAARALERRDLGQLALPFLRNLATRSGETAYVSVRHGSSRVAIQEVVSANPVRMVSGIGHPYPLYRGAPSKVLLAALPDDEIAGIVAADRVFDDSQRLRLHDELTRVRRDGYAISFAENVPSAASIAVPIRDHQRVVIAALGIAGVVPRWDRKRMLACLPALRGSAQQIMRLVDHPSHPDGPHRRSRDA